jgi:hypothetical protein
MITKNGSSSDRFTRCGLDSSGSERKPVTGFLYKHQEEENNNNKTTTTIIIIIIIIIILSVMDFGHLLTGLTYPEVSGNKI